MKPNSAGVRQAGAVNGIIHRELQLSYGQKSTSGSEKNGTNSKLSCFWKETFNNASVPSRQGGLWWAYPRRGRGGFGGLIPPNKAPNPPN